MTEGSELGNIKFNFDESTSSGPNTSRRVLRNRAQPALDHINHIETYSWPNRLRVALNIPKCQNSADGGSSNQRILRTTITDVTKLLETYKAEEIFVTIGWSGFSRYEIFNEGQFWKIMPSSNKLYTQNKDVNKICEMINKWIVPDLDYLLITNFLNIIHLKSFLESKSIKYIFTFGIADERYLNTYSSDVIDKILHNDAIRTLYKALEFGDKWIFNDPNKHFDKPNISFEDFIEHNVDKAFYEFATDHKVAFGNGRHPLEHGHALWAEYLHTEILRKGLL